MSFGTRKRTLQRARTKVIFTDSEGSERDRDIPIKKSRSVNNLNNNIINMSNKVGVIPIDTNETHSLSISLSRASLDN